MRKIGRKETIMLMLPVVALPGLALLVSRLQANPKQTLTLASVTVTPVAKSHRNDPDVKVNAKFNYSQSFNERYFRPNWSMTLNNAYITDGTGKKHYMITSVPNSKETITPTTLSRDFAVYPLWLRYFPKAAGRLTFHFTAVAHDGFKLPVSVVVRN